MKQLIISQSIYVASFISRCLFWIALIDNKWVDFTRDYPADMGSGFLTAMFPLQFLLFNFVPYSTLMLLHLRNFQRKTSDDQPEQFLFKQDESQNDVITSFSNRTSGGLRSPKVEEVTS